MTCYHQTPRLGCPMCYMPLVDSEWNKAILAAVTELEAYQDTLRAGGSGQSYIQEAITVIKELLKRANP